MTKFDEDWTKDVHFSLKANFLMWALFLPRLYKQIVMRNINLIFQFFEYQSVSKFNKIFKSCGGLFETEGPHVVCKLLISLKIAIMAKFEVEGPQVVCRMEYWMGAHSYSKLK